MSTQVERNSARIEQISDQMAELPTRAEVSVLVGDAIRRNNRLLIEALANHTHNDDDGKAVSRVPPGIEPTGAAPGAQPPR